MTYQLPPLGCYMLVSPEAENLSDTLISETLKAFFEDTRGIMIDHCTVVKVGQDE